MERGAPNNFNAIQLQFSQAGTTQEGRYAKGLNTAQVKAGQASAVHERLEPNGANVGQRQAFLLYTTPTPRDRTRDRKPSSA